MPKGVAISDDVKAQAIDAINKGVDIKETAHDLKVAVSTINGWIRRKGKKKKSHRKSKKADLRVKGPVGYVVSQELIRILKQANKAGMEQEWDMMWGLVKVALHEAEK